MKIIERLYCSYYRFQVRVGNGGIASFSALLLMLFSVMLYLYGLPLLISIFFSGKSSILNSQLFIPIIMVILFSVFVILFFHFIHLDKYKIILKNHQNTNTNQDSYLAIIFTIGGGLILFLSAILKMLQNRGDI